VVIALLGSPFSTSYARALRMGANADPLRFCQMNVALYGPRATRWALTEREVPASARSHDAIVLGRSAMGWRGDKLVVDLDEVSPWTRRPIRGRLELRPDGRPHEAMALDVSGRHLWRPIAPRAWLDVKLDEPGVRFQCLGYLDTNAGSEPLDVAFQSWTWTRTHAPDRRTFVTYAVRERGGETSVRALELRDGRAQALDGLRRHRLPRSRWGLQREVWTKSPSPPRVVRSLEDGPFYARDRVEAEVDGLRLHTLSETLSMQRLATRSASFLLGFRARRERC
jgi:carotenoid 1,2-hydratase